MPVINVVDDVPGVPQPEGPCNWPVSFTCVDDWETVPLDVQAAATDWAKYVLWALTGRRYGACPVTLRPCGPTCENSVGYLAYPVVEGGSTGPWMLPWLDGGVWRNCGCSGGCSCAATCEVVIPGPVAELSEVKVDGIVLAASAYRVDYVGNRTVLVRTDGGCWPQCQDMDVSTDEVGSFAITYKLGTPVPASGQIAAGLLAREFAKACQGQDCALPQQLASLSRNGVEVQVLDPTTGLDNGLTGIAQVDLWVRSVNPYRKAQRSRVYSPDLQPARYVS